MMQAPAATHPSADTEDNPLLQPWLTDFGLPPFARIAPQHFEPAFEVALAQHLGEIEAITADPREPDFLNTVEAFERSGALLQRLTLLFHHLCATCSTPALQAVERRIKPRLALHHSRIALNPMLFSRFSALLSRADSLGLAEEPMRVLRRLHRDFELEGAGLYPGERERCAAIAERLAVLSPDMSQNVQADEDDFMMILRRPEEIQGLPDFVLAAARQAAQARGVSDAWVFSLARSSVEPFLTFSARRDLRETLLKAWLRRGESEGRDNRALLVEVLALRAELARLHGQPDYARHALRDRMAGHPDAVDSLLDAVWAPACAAAAREREQLAELARRDGLTHPIEAWDWRYLADRVRSERYAIDESTVKPYLSLARMTEAMFDCAYRLFGLSFVERPDLPRHHPDARVWEVRDAAGEHLAIFIADNFARPGKRSGAWMSVLREQSGLAPAARPIVLNNNNFPASGPGEPVLLSPDEVRTLFHEFGHGLHGMLSAVTYPRLSGTSVERDFVELPSQLFEHWFMQPEVLRRHARHVQTDEPIPEALIAALRRAHGFGQGFATIEYTACAILDMALHRIADPAGLDLDDFERQALARIKMPSAIPMRHRLPHFQHIFGASYAAGYYVYLWAEVLDADAFEAFVEAGDIFDPPTADRLRRHVYAAGGLREGAEAFRRFRGRDPSVRPMLVQRGFAAAAEAVD